MSIVGQSVLFDGKAYGFGNKQVFPMGKSAEGGIAGGSEGALTPARIFCAKDCWALSLESRRLEAAFDPRAPVIRNDVVDPQDNETDTVPNRGDRLPSQPGTDFAGLGQASVNISLATRPAAMPVAPNGGIEDFGTIALLPGTTGSFIVLDHSDADADDSDPMATENKGGGDQEIAIMSGFPVIPGVPIDPVIGMQPRPVPAPGAIGLLLIGVCALVTLRRTDRAKPLGG